MARADFTSRVANFLISRVARSKRFTAAYVRILSTQAMQGTNHTILKLSLRATGFNPREEDDGTGEAHLLKKLGDLGLRRAVDVGANVGKYSEMLLRCGFDTVVAFEPHPDCLPDLLALQDQYAGRLKIEPFALGSSAGRVPLYFNPENLALASLSEEANSVSYVSNSSTIEVEVITLDSYFSGSSELIDLLKIDVEGSEGDVLRGAQEVLEKYPPRVIQLEFNNHHIFRGTTIHSLFKKLSREGQYEGYRILPGANGTIAIEPSSPYANVYFYSNYVFVRRDFVHAFNSL